jgi:hypothetical protein
MNSYQIVRKNNKGKFIELLLSDNPYHANQTAEIYSIIPETHSKMVSEVQKRWPDSVWKQMSTGNYKTFVAFITTEVGKFIIFRNGNNISHYNFAILNAQEKKFYFRQNVKDALDLIEIFSTPKEDLPLLISVDHYAENKTLLEKRFKAS